MPPPASSFREHSADGPLTTYWKENLSKIEWQVFGVLTLNRFLHQPSKAELRKRARSLTYERRVRGSTSRYSRGYRAASEERLQGAWDVTMRRLARNLGLRRSRRENEAENLLWVRAFEQHRDGQWHLNFVLASPENCAVVKPDQIVDLWLKNPARPKIGRAEVRVFDPTRSGAWYTVKDADKGTDVRPSRAAGRIIF